MRKDAVGGGMLWKLWRRAQMKSGTDADLRGSTTVQSQHVYAFPLVLYPPFRGLFLHFCGVSHQLFYNCLIHDSCHNLQLLGSCILKIRGTHSRALREFATVCLVSLGVPNRNITSISS